MTPNIRLDQQQPMPAPPAAQQDQTASGSDVPVPQLTSKQPLTRTVSYLPPAFGLERPDRRLTMDERIEVNHNYISAI